MKRVDDPVEMSFSIQASMERADPFSDQFENSFMQPSMEKFESHSQFKTQMEESTETDHLVSNGCVDMKGRIADKRTTGGWKASPFLIANEMAERLAFFAIAVNMVAYLFFQMHQSLPNAITHVTDWVGAAYVLTLLGAFIADAYLGRFLTIVVFSCIYAVGMVLLTLQASIASLRPPLCTAKPCEKATSSQDGILFVALALIAIGTGGIKPCVSSFGADQFDEADPRELPKKYAFFNWFFFAINMGAIVGITLMVYIQDHKGWAWGFGVPTGLMILSVVVLVFGVRYYRFQKPMGSPFTRFLQVIVSSARNHSRRVVVGHEAHLYEVSTAASDIAGARKLAHTSQFRFLDKAAIVTDPETAPTTSRWRLCTVTQVEELKSFVRVLPIWAATIALAISFSQLSTTFRTQADKMDRNMGPHFTIPAGSTPVFSAVNALILIPVYERLVVPTLARITGHRRGITSLQRIGVGLFVSIFAMASAAVVEKRRRDNYGSTPDKMSVFWLFPQFFLIGTAEVFTYVGQLEFFYDEATDGTRSISSAMFLSTIGLGSWLSTLIVTVIGRTTGREERGWLRNDLNKGKLDNFYWVLAGINLVNFFVYLWVSWRYKGRNDGGGSGSVADESPVVDAPANGDEGRELRSVVI